VLAQIAADPGGFAAPGGESQRQLEARVVSYITSEVLPTLQPGGLPALVVSHGLAIKWCVRCVGRGDSRVLTAALTSTACWLLRVLPRALHSFLRHVLASASAMTWKVQLDNTAITEVAWRDDGPAAGWHLGRVNDCSHLALAGLHPLLSHEADATPPPGT
jgi:broad specificity phosphatase PhoE